MKISTILILIFLTMSEYADARSRRGRSFGSRGSRSLFSTRKSRPSRSYKKPITPRQTSQSRSFLNQNKSGGFMKSMMGAAAGTVLGGFIFKALGFNQNSYGSGSGHPNSSGGGGMGLLFPILIIGGIFLYFRYKKIKKQENQNTDFHFDNSPPNDDHHNQETTSYHIEENTQEETDQLDLTHNQEFLKSRNKDFFAIQHAWSQKNLDKVKTKMTHEVYDEFMNEITEMNQKGHSSTLENLMINSAETVASWNEDSTKFVTLKFDVSLIEYEKDKTGNLVSGKENEPIDICEYWTFTQAGFQKDWKLSAVENPV